MTKITINLISWGIPMLKNKCQGPESFVLLSLSLSRYPRPEAKIAGSKPPHPDSARAQQKHSKGNYLFWI